MICPNCGNESTNNDIYCKHCGYEFQEKDFAENYIESSISEEIPSKKTVSISEPSFPEEVPFDEALKGNIPVSFDSKNQINNILDKDQQKKVSMESSISEEIPSDTDEADTSTSASFNEEVPFDEALKGNIPVSFDSKNQINDILDKDQQKKVSMESSIPEEIPSDTDEADTSTSASFNEEVPFDEALKGNIPVSFDSENQINNILDKDQQKKVSMESSISEETPSDTDEADTSTSASFNEEVPFESALKGNIPKNKSNNESDISSEIKDKEAKKSSKKMIPKEEASSPKKEKKSNAVLIIVLLLLGCVLLYFGIQYIQTGNIFPLSTAQPQTTATSQISSNKSDYSANIVETVINDKTYYSLIVYGKKGSTITIDNTKTYSIQGVSISIPIEPSDYIANSQVSNGMVAATIKVKIVGPDNEITTLSIPYNLKVDSASTQAVR